MPSARWAPIFILYFTTISLSNLSDKSISSVSIFLSTPPPPFREEEEEEEE